MELSKIEQQVSQLFEVGYQLQQQLENAPVQLKAMHTVLGMAKLRELLISHKAVDAIRPLINTKAGFRCDRKDYTNEQIADFVVDCMLHGDQLCGNHVNLIAGSRFVTKEGWTHKLRHLAGATQVQAVSFLPEKVHAERGDRSVRVIGRVAVDCSCVVNGTPFSMRFCDSGPHRDSRFEVDGRGVDQTAAIVQMRGKAEARALAKLYEYVTGLGEGEDVHEVIETTATEAAETVLIVETQAAAVVELVDESAQQPAALLKLEAEANDLVAKLDEPNATMLREWAAEFRSQPHLEALNLAWQAWHKVAGSEKPDPQVHSHMTSLKDALKKLLPPKAKP